MYLSVISSWRSLACDFAQPHGQDGLSVARQFQDAVLYLVFIEFLVQLVQVQLIVVDAAEGAVEGRLVEQGRVQLLLVPDDQILSGKAPAAEDTEKGSFPGVRALVPLQVFVPDEAPCADGAQERSGLVCLDAPRLLGELCEVLFERRVRSLGVYVCHECTSLGGCVCVYAWDVLKQECCEIYMSDLG